ncbi:MAG TPA: phosphomannomutase/phosphoglucomutase [Dehalococcoidia bacterium]|nr:phosphomannomutase/phosphoglucomutase [Dehalococcoidia bacterium]
MPNIDPEIFRAYDIRGKTATSLTPEVAEAIGKAFGSKVINEGGREVALGMDNRKSSPGLRDAFAMGLMSTGCNVVHLGLSTSPLMYFTVAHYGLDAGINVTGSHNPPDENGLKLVGKGARPIAGDEIQDIYTVAAAGRFPSGQGSERNLEPREAYFEHLIKATHLTRKYKLVVDTGNAVGGLFAPQFLRDRLGCEVIELFSELDDSFPNHLPDPQMPENMVDLQAKVRETGADLGIAFDGDGDRVGVVDENGERYDADYVVMVLARDVLSQHPGGEVILDTKASQALVDDISAHGGKPLLWKTGHSLIKIKMREDSAPLGGEASGHIFYQENFYLDDALFATCKLLSYLSKTGKLLSEHFAGVPKWYATPEIRVACPDDLKGEVVKKVAASLRDKYPSLEIDGIRATMPGGWAGVRQSNTGPNITLRFEANTPERLKEIQHEVEAIVAPLIPGGIKAGGH